jgi:hypothetical protein
MEKQDLDHKFSTHKANIGEEKTGGFINKFQQTLHPLLLKEKSYVNHLKLHHKIIFACLVFFALNLLWYGMWEIISKLPIIKNPIVALSCGALILIATGFFYESLISSDFNKKKYKRPTKKSIETKKNLNDNS